MSITFTNSNSNSCSAIAARVAERRHSVPSYHETIVSRRHDLGDEPLTQAEARAEVLRWFWQH
jgi:hypothetical protein